MLTHTYNIGVHKGSSSLWTFSILLYLKQNSSAVSQRLKLQGITNSIYVFKRKLLFILFSGEGSVALP